MFLGKVVAASGLRNKAEDESRLTPGEDDNAVT
jgi:hypothetical protein